MFDTLMCVSASIIAYYVVNKGKTLSVTLVQTYFSIN